MGKLDGILKKSTTHFVRGNLKEHEFAALCQVSEFLVHGNWEIAGAALNPVMQFAS